MSYRIWADTANNKRGKYRNNKACIKRQKKISTEGFSSKQQLKSFHEPGELTWSELALRNISHNVATWNIYLHSYSLVWTTEGVRVDDQGEGVLEMQITPKVIEPKKFRKNPEKPLKTPKKIQKHPQKTRKNPKAQESPKSPKICEKFAFPPLAAKI